MKKQRGFTLIELLIVMGCFLIINIVVVELFRLALTGEGVRTQSFTNLGQQRTALNLIAKDIRESDSIEKEYKGMKSLGDCLILKTTTGNRIIYSRDSTHPENLQRMVYDSKGQTLPMVIHRSLENIRFNVNNNLVSIVMISSENRAMSTYLRTTHLTVRIRKEL